jgi:hypothetical protein
MVKKMLLALTTLAMCVVSLATPADAVSRATTVTIVKPVDRHQVLRPGWSVQQTFYRGVCYEGSDTAIPGVDRCFVGNFIHDPCWPTVNRYGRYNGSFCPSAPWRRLGVLIKGHHHPDNYARGRRTWGIALPSGNRCSLAEGAGVLYKGRRVNYYCQHDRVALVGRPSKTTRVWHILAIKYSKQGRVIARWTAAIPRAWVAVSPYGG